MLNIVAKLAITAVLTAAQMALTMSRKIEGPRLDDLSVTLADYGTVIPRFWGKRRFETPIIWAENLKEVKKVSKTKGGKYKEYKYYGTWAVMIADHEIDAVSRIWMDKHLVVDFSKATPVSVAALMVLNVIDEPAVKLANGRNMRIYLGTETQDPDPRMEAWCEDQPEFGADSCPAFRGASYIVFEDIPLEKFGNRIPQITVEAIRNKADAYLYEFSASDWNPGLSSDFAFSESGQWMVNWTTNSGTRLEWWDIPSRSRIALSPSAGTFNGSTECVALAIDGTAYYASNVSDGGVNAYPYLFEQEPLKSPVGTLITGGTTPLFYDACRVFDRGIVRDIYLASRGQAGFGAGASWISDTQSARDFCIDASGQIWGLFHPTGSSADLTLKIMSGATTLESHTITGLVTRSGPSRHCAICHVPEYAHFFIYSDGNFYFVDDSTFVIKSSGAAAFSYVPETLPRQVSGGRKSFWILSSSTGYYEEYSLETGALIRSIGPRSLWDPANIGSHDAYDPFLHAFWSRASGGAPIRYLDRVASDPTTLATIVDEVSGWCGLTDADTSQLTQVIEGYSVTQGPGKDMIAPLLDAYDVDARPHDFGVQFLVRSGVSTGTITAGEFVREGDSARYVATVAQDTDLPRRVSLNFADKTKDQQGNTAVWQRPEVASDSSREVTIDLTTWVGDADEAKPLVERYGRRLWNERQGVTLSLTAQHLALEPGDVKTLALDDVSWTARCVKATVKGSALETEWKRDFPSLNVLSSNPGSGLDARDADEIIIPAQSKGFVLDTPLLRDTDNGVNPLLYFAAGPFTSGSYTGTTFYKEDAGVYDEEWGTIESSAKSFWGYVSEEMGSADPWLWDRGTTLTIDLLSGGGLSTVTEAQIDADGTLNLAAIGAPGRYELVQFTTATLVSGNTWTVSGFKRGRRGTEWAVGLHEAGDEFLLLTHVANTIGSLSEVGEAYSFKTATIGRETLSPSIDFTFSGATLKPYAPARVKWSTDGTDLFGEIIRRTRVGGSWVGGSVIPLSENSEAYEVEVYNGATLKRTISVSGTNSFTITAAMLSADGLSLTSRPTVQVYQVSDAVGRGFALAA